MIRPRGKDQYVSLLHALNTDDRSAGLKSIFEGRLARRRVVLEQKSKVGSLVDHPINDEE